MNAIPEEIIALWNTARLKGKRGLSTDEAREILNDLLKSYSTNIYLIVDAIDEAEGFQSAMEGELKHLRDAGVAVFSTVRRDPRIRYDLTHCHHCGTIGLELYMMCKACAGTHLPRFDVCMDCYNRHATGCHYDASHILKPPSKVNIEVKSLPQDLEAYAHHFLDEERHGGDTGADDDMFQGSSTNLAEIERQLGLDFLTSLPIKVSNAADGNFLYAHLFLQRLRQQRSPYKAAALAWKLNRGTFDDLDTQYHDMLTLCLNSDQREGAQVAYDHFAIVASALDVLTLDQMCHAVAVADGDRSLDDFVTRCHSRNIVLADTKGLLAIDHRDDPKSVKVAFFHRSLSTYVAETEATWFPDAHQRMFEACTAYMKLDKFSRPFESRTQLDSALKEYPFASYAACYWGFHAQRVPPNVRNSLNIIELLVNDDRLSCIMQVAWHTRSAPESTWDVAGGITLLHACVFYGLEDLCRALLGAGLSADPVEETYNQTPLFYACRKGYAPLVEMLLRADAEPNHLSTLSSSALLEAIDNNHDDVLTLLLASDRLDVNLRGSGQQARTALVRAAENGQMTVVKKLLAHSQIDVNKADGWGCTALSRAVQWVQSDCIRLLLDDTHMDLAVQDSRNHRTALDWTAERLSIYNMRPDDIEDIARVLLEDHRKPKVSHNAIALAIEDCRPKLLQIFVEAALDHTYLDDHGRNFLHLAATAGDCAIVELIYDRLCTQSPFDIDLLDKYKASALHSACRHLTDAHVQTIEFLLKKGADPSRQDQQGFTASRRAQSASPRLWASHVRSLFDSGSGSDTVNDQGSISASIDSVLRSADIDALKTIVDRSNDPLDVEVDPYTLSTVLHLTVDSSLPDDVRCSCLRLLLPRCKQLVNETDSLGRTCAHTAVLQQSLACLDLLVEAGIHLDVKDKWEMTAFDLAQSFDRIEICVYLIRKGAQLPPRRTIRPYMLYAAVQSGDYVAVQRLVEADVDVYYRDPETRLTALQRAEELWANAEDDFKDGVKINKRMQLINNPDYFREVMIGDPEVVKRRRIMDVLREKQNRIMRSKTEQSHTEGLSKLITKLKTLDPSMLLVDFVTSKGTAIHPDASVTATTGISLSDTERELEQLELELAMTKLDMLEKKRAILQRKS